MTTAFADAPATRDEALLRLEAFRPRMGRAYARGRNVDHGPGNHEAVSTLSPWIRRRLVTERETVAAALDAHGAAKAEKFIQEVVWRGYFKGWLAGRPAVWEAYRDDLADDLARLDRDPGLAARVAAAEAGETGLAPFDAWVRELVETGYLHNHARMWFASIWIFTLRLPWRIGADFFYRHLLDGDPASNTLSWRWVGGLHTRGRAYAARASNIAKNTEGRFSPSRADLNENPTPLSETEEPEGLPPHAPPRPPSPPEPGRPTLLLLTEEDGRAEDFDLAALDIRGAATLAASHLRSPRAVAPMVAAFEAGALADSARRAGPGAAALTAADPAALAGHAAAVGATQIATPFVPRGPLHDWLTAARPALEAEGITLTEWQRSWDARIWPHATGGFFKVKKTIPKLLAAEGLV